MEVVIAILIGVLYTTGVYMMLRRSIVKFIIGIIFFSNATNLLVFVSAGLIKGKPAFVKDVSETDLSDPLPQALVLTAIVIGFGIIAFTLALVYKFFAKTGTDDLDQLKKTDS